MRMMVIRMALRWGGDGRLLSIIVHVPRLFPLPLVTQKPSQWDDSRLELPRSARSIRGETAVRRAQVGIERRTSAGTEP
jgi:hypothetical protein